MELKKAPGSTVSTLPQRIQTFYKRVSDEGSAALSELDALFTKDIHFMNPVVDEKGIDTFRAQWKRAFSMYTTFKFTPLEVLGDEEHFTLSYEMSVGFFIGPVLVIPLVTECRGRNGKVYWMRDYFDTMTTLLQPVPPLLWLYKTVMRALVA